MPNEENIELIDHLDLIPHLEEGGVTLQQTLERVTTWRQATLTGGIIVNDHPYPYDYNDVEELEVNDDDEVQVYNTKSKIKRKDAVKIHSLGYLKNDHNVVPDYLKEGYHIPLSKKIFISLSRNIQIAVIFTEIDEKGIL
jgi:hypothetical protein